MAKVNIIYWSGTGNTERMAEAIKEGLASEEVKLLSVSDATTKDVEEAEVVVLGCPSMGDEALEEGEMEPFVDSISNIVKGKKVALFGSYGWGDGQWMRDWEERMESYGAEIKVESLIHQGESDDSTIEECKAFAQKLV
ncbi:flavodoxin [Clostridium botulinum]|uniref:Flavodoxin n=1 Tax=Clostridium botulinum TaxID=1491 RepID=A0A846J314_CLOBO|nr:flavodoxin [Clostridium botulinum]ACA53627.1 flavodoxin [Clostridium botulinum A3 str. Loch Maree]NFH66896.1 flavodoxin [Clostridium botulinum]NFJ07642.1 flavodoxin [Clostridium botulinum]NFK13568.1 flavodoxin [Clostridium botulinum]NFM94122.1 flavodoxin [Clostridium botulinum]